MDPGSENSANMNGSHTNGANGNHPNGTNGNGLNGTHGNGINGNSLNGNGLNGNGLNGHHTNGVNGNGLNGHPTNGANANGADDIHKNGVNGSEPNGASANGRHTDGDIHVGAEDAAPIPIAICGMACRLPGGLHTPEQLWEFLLAKGDARGRVPESRYNVDAYYSPTVKPGSVKSEYGYFLDESIDLGALDGSFFNLGRSEAERADPHQRQMLEVVRECVDDAGETNLRGGLIGCYMGSFGEDWIEMWSKDTQQWGMHRVGGYGDFLLSNRISYEMDLHGPSMTIRTGCSAALVCLHEACVAIQRGDCTSAIVGGANLILGPNMTAAMTEQGVLSADGNCKSFSADANGYGRGEAITAIFIKPLSEAIKDKNPIRAVIRSTATNHDGKTPGLTHPNTESHESMMRKAYKNAGLDFSETAFVECHGTGTAVGDPIEANAVARVFGDSGVYIGSVKPNLGHSEGASGLTSLLKVVMALQNRIIPPNIKFSSPNPNIPFKERKLTVPLEPTPWPEDKYERTSVNSFGIGGANAHVIIDSARSFNIEPKALPVAKIPQLLVYSANSADSLTKIADGYQEYITKNPGKLGDLAYTLANRRQHLPHRAFVVATQEKTGLLSPASKISQSPPDVVMVFTGQGAQWPQMAKELLQSNDVFRKTIKSLDKHLSSLPSGPEWSLEQELLKPSRSSRIETAQLSQPACTAIQLAMIDYLDSIGIKPTAVVGHSSGEIAAAYASGALTYKEAITAAWLRGEVTLQQKRKGAMAAIGLGWNDVEQFLVPGVVRACENSPKSTTLSGDGDKLEAVVAEIQKAHPDVLARMLKVDKAYHSYHMAEVGDVYHASMKTYDVIGQAPKKCSFFSSVTGKLLETKASLGPKYWQTNLESPVMFSTAVTSMLEHPDCNNVFFLEIGPHSALSGPLRQIAAEKSMTVPYASALIRKQNCYESMLTAVGKLFSQNIPVDFSALMPGGNCLPDLPRYPWNHDESYWYESRISKEWRHRGHPYHDLLGFRVAESTDMEPTWRNMLHLDNVPWVRDHIIGDNAVFPFAGYVAMVGEAVRQITGIGAGFSLRHVLVNSALLLTEGKPIEMMTAFRPCRLTDSLDSSWWEFTVTSHDGYAWTKHCTGQVRALSEPPRKAQDQAQLPRGLVTRKVYETMHRTGLKYGRQFQRLEDITSGTVQPVASAKVLNNKTGDEANYHLHPVIIDACLQLLSVAATKGFTIKPVMSVPTVIEKLVIHRTAEDVNLNVSAIMTKFGAITGNGSAVSNGETVLEMGGVRLAALDDNSSEQGRTDKVTTRCEWGQHIDFMDLKTLIKSEAEEGSYTKALKELSNLCLLLTQRRLPGDTSTVSHLNKYSEWVRGHINSADVSGISELPDEQLEEKINLLTSELADTSAASVATALNKIGSEIAGIYNGEINAMELMLAEETLAKVFSFRDQLDKGELLRQIAHSKPSLRVLEVGAGTGAAAIAAYTDLTHPDGSIFYSDYTITDVTSSLLLDKKESTNGITNVQHSVLNLAKDPVQQGFEEGSYDIVIAANAIHATASIADTLKNIRKLLRPNGRLLLQELSPSSAWPNLIFGVLPWWWCGSADERSQQPYVGEQRWRDELRAAGFAEPTVVPGAGEYLQENTVIIAEPATSKSADRAVSLIAQPDDGAATALSQTLIERGFDVNLRGAEEIPPPEQDVIVLLETNSPFFEHITDAQFEFFKNIVENVGSAGLFWITRPSQMQCLNPAYAQVVGAARTIRSEMATQFATCEVDDIEASISQLADVFERFTVRDNERTQWLEPDFEYAINKGVVNVGRYYPFSLSQELLTANQSEPVVLDTKKPGLLNALTWSRRVARPLAGDDVKVDVYAGGLNFRDVLSANGIIEVPEEGFGLEATGVVSELGPDVKDLRVGDRVMLFSRGSFSTSIITSERLCEVIPDNLDFDDGASMPCVYATAIYSLVDIGGLEKGQSVLIHSACGGVGIAAIQVARMIGADIYVSVGSEEKIKYLMDTFQIPRHRIFNSRNDSFVEGVMRETDGVGVDVVLNSLSGELLHATWRCVAEFGKMVEIGKRDLLGSGKLDMDVFMANRSYCCVDMDQMCFKRKAICKKLLRSVTQYFQEGHILPIRPIKVFDADSVQETFRYMQRGQHMGKIVLSIRDSAGNLKFDSSEATRSKVVELDGSASYLLIGGLGGLGRAVSRWMVEHGARHLVYLSRSAGSRTEEQATIRELKSMGCEVTLVKGSVTLLEDVEKAITASPKLRGILQMSMILRDNAVPRMTYEDWTVAVEPKIQGTWNLHQATEAAGSKLDFLLLFSSISGIIGQPGQANYASASTFLDSFVQYRTERGLPASTIDIGDVTDIGVISGDEGLRRVMKLTGAYGINEQELLDAISMSMSFSSSSSTANVHGPASTFVSNNNFVVGLASATPLETTENRSIWRKDMRMAIYHNTNVSTSTQSGGSSDSLNAFLGSVRHDASRLKEVATANTLAKEIGKKLLALIMKPEEDLNTSTPLSNLGMDSLVAIEMRTWWRQAFGFDISVLEIMGMASLDALGIHAAQGMLKAMEDGN